MKTIKIGFLHPNPNNIRKEFDDEFLSKLSYSIKKFGVVVPILALKDGTIVAGEQRWRSAKLAGKKELLVGQEVIFADGSRQDMDVVNAIENMMRRYLN